MTIEVDIMTPKDGHKSAMCETIQEVRKRMDNAPRQRNMSVEYKNGMSELITHDKVDTWLTDESVEAKAVDISRILVTPIIGAG